MPLSEHHTIRQDAIQHDFLVTNQKYFAGNLFKRNRHFLYSLSGHRLFHSDSLFILRNLSFNFSFLNMTFFRESRLLPRRADAEYHRFAGVLNGYAHERWSAWRTL